MIIKVVINHFLNGEIQGDSSYVDVEVDSSWYTAQNYFDENLKSEIFTDKCDAIVLKWQNKNYVFKRKR